MSVDRTLQETPAYRADPVGRIRAVRRGAEVELAARDELSGDGLGVEPRLVVDEALERVELRVRPRVCVRARGQEREQSGGRFPSRLHFRR